MWELNLRSYLTEAKNRILGSNQPKTEARILASEQKNEERKRGAENVFNQVTSAVQSIVDSPEFETDLLTMFDNTEPYIKDVQLGSTTEIRTENDSFLLKVLAKKKNDSVSIGIKIFPTKQVNPNLNSLLVWEESQGPISERVYYFESSDSDEKIVAHSSFATHQDFSSMGFGKALFFTSHLVVRRFGEVLQKKAPTVKRIDAVITDAATLPTEAQSLNYTGWTTKMAILLGYTSIERRKFGYKYLIDGAEKNQHLAIKSRQ